MLHWPDFGVAGSFTVRQDTVDADSIVVLVVRWRSRRMQSKRWGSEGTANLERRRLAGNMVISDPHERVARSREFEPTVAFDLPRQHHLHRGFACLGSNLAPDALLADCSHTQLRQRFAVAVRVTSTWDAPCMVSGTEEHHPTEQWMIA